MSSDDDKTRTHIVLTKGTMVSHYRIVEKIGAGGMGEVYLAEDTKLSRKVALKFMPAHLASDARMRARFVREARAAAILEHPNIVTVHEVGEFRGRPFIVMQHVDGESLRDAIKKEYLTVGQIVDIAIQSCRGLEAAHQATIIHRDIKSSNILLDRSGSVKILDFGLAIVRDSEQLTQTGTVLGTVAYMSPEQATAKEIDSRSDIWSLGVVLYEMLTGWLPFGSGNDHSTVYSILNEEPTPISEKRKGESVPLEQVVARCLAKNPDDRYQNCAELLEDLSLISEGLRPVKGRVWSRKMSRQKRMALASFSFLAVVSLAVISYVFLIRSPSVASIAVLPFDNLTGDSTLEYLCVGVPDDIRSRLTQLSDLRVIAGTSSEILKAQNLGIRQIGETLDVTNILEGTVQRSGERLRITARLVDAGNEELIWSERFDLSTTDLFTIQDSLSNSVAGKLEIEISDEEREVLGRDYTKSEEAYSLYLKFRMLFYQFSEQSNRRCLELLDQAIAIDSQYVLAYAAKSYQYSAMALLGQRLPADMLPKARQAAARALEIDPEAAESHLAAASYKFWLDWDWEAADRHFNEAMRRRPAATALSDYSYFLAAMGRYDEAVAAAEAAFRLDPLSEVTHTDLSWAYINAEHFGKAHALLSEMRQLFPGSLGTDQFLVWTYMGEGHVNEAISVCDRMMERQDELSSWQLAMVGNHYGRAGKRDKAQQILDGMLRAAGDEYVDPFYLAVIHAGLGNIDDCFDWLEKAYRIGSPSMVYLLMERDTDSHLGPQVTSDPRFKDLLVRMRFIEH